MSSQGGRIAVAVVTSFVGAALLAFSAACASDSSPSRSPTALPPLDPGAIGTYGVGTTTMTFTRETAGGPRALRTLFWYPTGASSGGEPQADAAPASGQFPIVIISHGGKVEPQSFQYLARHLASWGFIVAAPGHNPGNSSADCPLFPCDEPAWYASLTARPDDFPFVLDQIVALKGDPSQPLGSVVDVERTALIGNSLGGLLAIPKANLFGAAIFLAPGPGPNQPGMADNINVPTLVIASGKDPVVPIAELDTFYGALPAEIAKAYVTLVEGHHISYVDDCTIPFLAVALCNEVLLPMERGHELINHYVTAFLQTHLVGDERYAHFLSESVLPDAVVAGR